MSETTVSAPAAPEAPPGTRGSHRRSLSRKILVRAVAIALIPLLLIGSITLGSLVGLSRRADQTLESERRQLGNEVAGQRLRTEASAVAQQLDGFLHERISDVTGWASSPTVTRAAIAAAQQSQPYAATPNAELEERFADTRQIGTDPVVTGFLQHQLEREPAFSSIYFTERNGYNVTGTGELAEFVQRGKEWWISAQIRGLHFGAVEFDTETGTYSLPLSARVKNPTTGEGFGGVLQARLGVDVLQQVARRNAGLEGRQVTILTGDGLLLAETGPQRSNERIMRRGVHFGDQKRNAVNAALTAARPGFLVQDDLVVGYAPLSSVRDRPGGTATDIDAFLGIDANPINWVVLIEQPTTAALSELDGLTQVRQGLNRTAVQLAALGLVALILAVVAATTVSSRLSGRIVQPLRALRSAAHDIAERQLPELVARVQRADADDDLPTVPAVRVDTGDEVEEVADAFNVVRDTAVDLAVEQARSRRNVSTMFVNLGRRNQGLLSKQLEFIEELVRDESDARLRQILFRLDHLATRMRRNAESLLVLAGEEPPRRWSRPIALRDVVQGAIAEVEAYQRVDVRNVHDVSIVGKAASDVSHLLAELIENAAEYSPPESPVLVAGWWVDDGYGLAIIDEGIGMGDDELREANERLASPASLERVPSNHLGFFVVGRLAARYGITVRLVESSSDGVAAKVLLPRELLADESQPEGRMRALGSGRSRRAIGGPTEDVVVIRRESTTVAAGPGNGASGERHDTGPLPVASSPAETADRADTATADAMSAAEREARRARERLGGFQRAVRDGRAALSSRGDGKPRDPQ